MKTDVLLVVMPFAAVGWPAIGVSLLQGGLRRCGILSKILYLNIDFCEFIGGDLYRWVAEQSPETALIGEWIFAEAAFGPQAPKDETRFVNLILGNYPFMKERMEQAVRARRAAIKFTDLCVDRTCAYNARIIGFTTTFQQNVASLAVARKLKERLPNSVIVFGGANCEDEMGPALCRCFPWVDYVFSGEADRTFVEFVQRLLARNDAPSERIISGAPIQNLDSLPYPDFDDYFETQKASSEKIMPSLMIEMARGCWWGQKQQCTFCGLNGATIAFRSKSPERALEEIRYLVERYRLRSVRAVDNILDMKYIQTVLPELIRQRMGLSLFFEVKANLSKDHIRQLVEAGVSSIQPGIESLSTAILKLIQKGSKAMHNIQLLKWCEEFRIAPTWNLIYGFPKEPAEEYLRMAELIPLLTHLRPPDSCGPVRLDRFSPYFERPPAFGIRNIRPHSAYPHVYPLEAKEITRLAYYFEFDYCDAKSLEDYIEPLMKAVYKWMLLWRNGVRPVLRVQSIGSNRICIQDTRPCAVQDIWVLDGLEADLYLYCDSMKSFPSVALYARSTPYCASFEQTERILDGLIRRKLMIRDGDTYLSLATFGLLHGSERPHALMATIKKSAETNPVDRSQPCI